QPVLGICLGMQLLYAHSEEEDVECLGIVPGLVRRLRGGIKVPHVGWNNIVIKGHPLLRNLDESPDMYFVHSYFVAEDANTISSANYGQRFSSAMQCRNYYGVQFHPEKSGKAGTQILQNFLDL